MAFMMPVVKNDYNLYNSRPSSNSSSRKSSAPQSRISSLSSSPRGSGLASFVGSPTMSPSCRSSLPSSPSPKSSSETSLHKFHCKLLNKLRKTFRGKGGESDLTRSATFPA